MLFRITQKLNKKIDAGPLPTVPLDESPWGDWSARLFTADRTQYIMLTNTTSLYSACAADLDGSGTVGLVDLVELLAHWTGVDP